MPHGADGIPVEADALGRLAILAGAQLDFVQSTQQVEQAERVAAASGDPVATTHALDARKNLLAYQGAVGEVGALRLTDDGMEADLVIDDDAPPIPANSRAVVANRSAVGEQYVDLQPLSDGGPYLTDG